MNPMQLTSSPECAHVINSFMALPHMHNSIRGARSLQGVDPTHPGPLLGSLRLLRSPPGPQRLGGGLIGAERRKQDLYFWVRSFPHPAISPG